MKFKFAYDYEEIAPLVDGPYNDPQLEDDHDEEEFDREYERVRTGLTDLVRAHCTQIGASSDLINIGHRTGPSRGIGLVVDESAKDYLVSFVEIIWRYLSSLDEDYCVPINLILDESKTFKDLNLGITRSEEILAHAEKPEWFREVGIRF